MSFAHRVWSVDREIIAAILDSKEIAEMLESTVKQLTYRDSVVSPQAMLIEFHDLVNRRLSVNLAILEVVLYGSMVVSAANGDYSLPKPWTTAGVGVMRLILQNRSSAPEMAYERHKDAITAPSNYINDNKMDHPFDSLIVSSALDYVKPMYPVSQFTV